MIHYGDITKISGYNVPIVDCVTFGAPCQDLSVAGRREGMKHTDMGDDETTRSGLFHEAIRIIKEMREKDVRVNGRPGEFIRPRFAVYENVPGAFSSNKGKDFKIVLESLAKIAQKDAVIPMPPKDKWTTSGCIVGDGWSIAWRVFDAQFWGVPQRRRRIALVADFGGGCAQEVLFERKGLRGDSTESRTERKGSSEDAQGCIGVYDRDGEERGRRHVVGFPYSINHQGGNVEQIIEDKTGTLTASMNSSGNNKLSVAYSIENHPADSRVNIDASGKVQTLTSRMGTGGGNVPMVMVEGLDCYNQSITGDKSKSLTNSATDSDHIPCVVKAVGCDIYNLSETGDVAASITTATGQGASNTGPSVIVMDRASYNQGENAKYNIGIDENGKAFSHIAKGPGAVCYVVDQGGGKSGANVTENLSPTLTCTHGGEPVICLQGNGIDRADSAGCNGKGWKEGTSYTLNTVDRPAVVYIGENITSPLNKTNPQIGDSCHTLTSDSRNYLVETKPHYSCYERKNRIGGDTDAENIQ